MVISSIKKSSSCIIKYANILRIQRDVIKWSLFIEELKKIYNLFINSMVIKFVHKVMGMRASHCQYKND